MIVGTTMEAAPSLGRRHASTTSSAARIASRSFVSSGSGLPGAIKVDPNAGHSLGKKHATAHPENAGHTFGRRASSPSPVTSQDLPAAPAPAASVPAAVAMPAGGAGGGAVPYPESPAEPPPFVADGIPRAVPGPTPAQIAVGLAVVAGVGLIAWKVLR
jgi:hypothetical protein